MSILISLVIALCVVALLLWALTQLPLDAQIVKIIRVVVIVVACLWVLAAFTGHGPTFPGLRWDR